MAFSCSICSEFHQETPAPHALCDRQEPQEFDLAKGEANRDEAMARVEAHAKEQWKGAAERAVHQVALTHLYRVETDMVVASIPPEYTTHNMKALGPVMKKAVRMGWIEPTGEFGRTARPQGNGRPMRLYRSLIYEPHETQGAFSL